MGENIPQESETIAVRRSIRLAEKIKNAREGLDKAKGWWADGWIEFSGILIVFFLNFYLVLPFFGTAAPEISFSGPTIPLLVKLLEIFGIPLSYGLQIVYITFFLFFPPAFYLFIKKIGGRKLSAFLAVLTASLPFYPFALVRAQSAFIGFDGPHIASLTLILFGLYSLIVFLREGQLKNLLLTSTSGAFIMLSSPFAFFMFLIFASITTFSEMLLGQGRLKFVRFVLISIVIYGLTAFWYNPYFGISALGGPLGEEIRFTVAKLVPISLFALPLLGAIGFLIFDRKPNLQPVFIACFYTIVFAIIVWAGGGFFPSHPSRYLSEFGISLSLIFGIATVRGLEHLKKSLKEGAYKLPFELPANLIIFFLMIAQVILLVAFRENFEMNSNILGLWTGVEKGKIWMEKENFNGFYSVVGYGITSITIFTLVFLAIKSIKIKNDEAV